MDHGTFRAGEPVPATAKSAYPSAISQAGVAALGPEWRINNAGAAAREGIASTPAESSAAHLVGGVLRGSATATWSGPHPCTSRLFRLVDRNGGGPIVGGEFQSDAARVGSVAGRSFSRHEAEGLWVLRNHFRLQPSLHSGALSGNRLGEDYRFAVGRSCTGTRGISTEGRRACRLSFDSARCRTPPSSKRSRFPGRRLCSTARSWTRL